MPEIRYTDPETGYEWVANFETQDEAMSQAVADTQTYGGVSPQAIVDDQGTTLVTQEEIIAAAE